MSSDPSGEFHRIRRLPPYVFAEVNTAKAKALKEGTYKDTLTFTNTSTGKGNTTRPVELEVTYDVVEDASAEPGRKRSTPSAPAQPVKSKPSKKG